MAHDVVLAARVRAALRRTLRVEEKRMFGGIVFMVDGKMCVCVGRGRLMCRIDPSLHDAILERPGCRTVVMRRRRYRGYVYVDGGAVKTKRALSIGSAWLWTTTKRRSSQGVTTDPLGNLLGRT